MPKSSQEISELITENKKLQVELDDTNIELKMLNQALEIAGLGIWQYELANGQVIWTKEVYNIYELDPKTDAPRLEEALHFSSEEEQETIEKSINDGLLKGKPYSFDCTIKTRSGKIKHLYATGKPLYNEEKKLTLSLIHI